MANGQWPSIQRLDDDTSRGRLVVSPVIFTKVYTTKRWLFRVSEPSRVCFFPDLGPTTSPPPLSLKRPLWTAREVFFLSDLIWSHDELANFRHWTYGFLAQNPDLTKKEELIRKNKWCFFLRYYMYIYIFSKLALGTELLDSPEKFGKRASRPCHGTKERCFRLRWEDFSEGKRSQGGTAIECVG